MGPGTRRQVDGMSIRVPTSAYYDLVPGDYVLVSLPDGKVQGCSYVANAFYN